MAADDSDLIKRKLAKVNYGKKREPSTPILAKMIALSLNYGYNFVTKALGKMNSNVKYDEIERLLRCLNIPFGVDEETQFREFLIERDLMRVQRSENLMDIDLTVKVAKLIELIKERIKRADPSADFSDVKNFPEKPTVFLNNLKSDLMESCLEDIENVRVSPNAILPEGQCVHGQERLPPRNQGERDLRRRFSQFSH